MNDFYNRYKINPETMINQIIDSVAPFNEDILQYALHNYHNGNEDKVRILIDVVASNRVSLDKEYHRLHDYSLHFNEEFVLGDNECFSTSLKLLRRLRTGIKTTKDIFRKFCPYKHDKARRYQLYRIQKPNVFDASGLSSKANRCLDLFDISSYIPIVQELFGELSSFFDILINSMRLCKDVIDKEKKIKSDSKECLKIYNKFKAKVLNEMKGIYDLLTEDSVETLKQNNPMALLMDKYGNDEGYAQAGFHNGTIADARNAVLLDAYQVKVRMGLTKAEQALWGTDVELVMKIRFIIDHFDELLPQYATRKHLDAKYIVLFAKWCGVYDELDNFIDYFNEIYNRRNRTCASVLYKALDKAKNKMTAEGSTDDEYEKFLPLFQSLLAKMEEKTQNVKAS